VNPDVDRLTVRVMAKPRLLHEFYSLENWQAAWQHIKANNGTAGVDGETIEHFQHHADTYIPQLIKAIKENRYTPLPLRQIFIPKKDNSWRTLGIPTVRDRLAQQALLNILHPALEPHFAPSSFAYRPGRSHLMAVRQIAKWRDQGYHWVLDADLVAYFDNVQHDRLLAEVQERLPQPEFLRLIEMWLKAGILTKEGVKIPVQGIPIGSGISPILANVYLDDFDELLATTEYQLVRYADDFTILARQEQQIHTAYELVVNILTKIGLQINPTKTQIANFDRGFRFLGHTFVGKMAIPNKIKSPRQVAGKRRATVNINAEQAVETILQISFTPPAKPTTLEKALLESLQASDRPIPPPLFVLLGYQVREPAPVSIESSETPWTTSMTTLYLVQQGATLQKEQGRFIIKAPGKSTPEVIEIPIAEVERILVFGNIQLSTTAISTCLAAQIPVVFLSQSGEYKGHLWSAENFNLPLEAAQFRCFEDLEFQLEMSKKLIMGKLWNSKQLLLKLRRARESAELTTAIAGITQDLEAVESAPAEANMDTLRGFEGIAANRYFGSFGQLITNPGFSFNSRNRRPPLDPVNSLLSFGYTLLFNNVMSLLLAEGLHPYLGNLHRSDRKAPHLALDLMEEFRSPIVDSLVLKVVNQKILRPTDFTFPDQNGGVYLEDTPRRLFLKSFEDRMATATKHPDCDESISYRRIIQLQVQRYKKAVLGEASYESFRRST
jgi:CRISP-associated protein Cas1